MDIALPPEMIYYLLDFLSKDKLMLLAFTNKYLLSIVREYYLQTNLFYHGKILNKKFAKKIKRICMIDKMDDLARYPVLKELCFSSTFDEPMVAHKFPDSLIKISLGFYYNRKLAAGDLPVILQELTFGYSYRHEIVPGVLPPYLTKLTLGWHFDQPISVDILPRYLKDLDFGWHFNHEIKKDVLPVLLERLTFGWDYNYPIGPNLLPATITDLSFGGGFNQPIEKGYLPKFLKNLSLGWSFNQAIGPDVLPKNLKKLSFGACYNHPLEGIVPETLEYLELAKNYRHAVPKIRGVVKFVNYE